MTSRSVIIDTNIIFSALVPQASFIRDILLETNLTFIAPNYLISEIYRHKEKLIKVSRLTESEFYIYFNGIVDRVQFIPIDFVSLNSRLMAYELCKDIDAKDTPFIALSLELHLPLWTGDRKLQQGLKAKGFDNFFNF